jgi:flagellar hook-length control protein FliK
VSVPSVVSESSAMPPARPSLPISSALPITGSAAAANAFAALLEHAGHPAIAVPPTTPAIDGAAFAVQSPCICDGEAAGEIKPGKGTIGAQGAAKALQIIGATEIAGGERAAEVEMTMVAAPAAQLAPDRQDHSLVEDVALAKQATAAQSNPSATDIQTAEDDSGPGERQETEADPTQADRFSAAESHHLPAAAARESTDSPAGEIAPFLVTPSGVTVMAPIAAAVAQAPPQAGVDAADILPRVDKLVALQTAAGGATSGVNKATQTPAAAEGDDELNTAAGSESESPDSLQEKDSAGRRPAAASASPLSESDRALHPRSTDHAGGGHAQTPADGKPAVKAGAEAAQQFALAAPALHAGTAVAANSPNAGPVAPFAAPANAIPLAGLAVEIATRADAGIRRFEIRLDPPELGRIDVRLDVDRDGNVTSRLMVDRPDTLDLLRRDAAQIERALQEAGLKTTGNALEFSLRQQSLAREEMAMQSSTQLVVAEDDPAPLAALRQGYGRLLGLGGGVDIRV